MPRVRQDLVDRQERNGFLTVAAASLRSGVCERTIRAWTRNGTVRVRRVGPMLVFVDAAHLDALAGAPVAGTDDEILAELRDVGPSRSNGTTRPDPTAPMRELTLERDE